MLCIRVQILNKSGFVKILKKFDKTAGWAASTLYLAKVNEQPFVRSGQLDAIIAETEVRTDFSRDEVPVANVFSPSHLYRQPTSNILPPVNAGGR